MTTTPSSRTDPRVLRTRQLIRDAYINLLEEVDPEKITVNRIAERATINRVTFYLHYRDIQDMLERMAEDMIVEIQAILGDKPDKSLSRDKDWTMMVHILEHIAENAKFYKMLLASKRIPIFTERFTKMMADIITSRAQTRSSEWPMDVSSEIAIWYGTSAFIGTIICWLRNDMPYTPHFLAKQLSMLFRMQQDTARS